MQVIILEIKQKEGNLINMRHVLLVGKIQSKFIAINRGSYISSQLLCNL